MVKKGCPRCGQFSWLLLDEEVVIQRCLCGLRKPVAILKDGELREYVYARKKIHKLPKPETKLGKCFAVLVQKYPEPLKTTVISGVIKESAGDTSSQLLVLMNRGLIIRLVPGRGKRGGSVWGLSETVISILKEKGDGFGTG